VIPPAMPLSDIQVRNLKPRDKAYKVSDFEGLFVLVKVNCKTQSNNGPQKRLCIAVVAE
jgi:hypothetical protein